MATVWHAAVLCSTFEPDLSVTHDETDAGVAGPNQQWLRVQ